MKVSGRDGGGREKRERERDREREREIERDRDIEIGRASWRERGEISGVAVSLKKKYKKKHSKYANFF